MFSLIITIVSIALVAALALATLFYGGGAFRQGTAEAQATKVVNQGQQLLAASELYYAEKGQWPQTTADLVSQGYLKTVPVAQLPLNQAMAAAGQWTMPLAGEPVFLIDASDPETCRTVNSKGYGQPGILTTVHENTTIQCFGKSLSSLTVVVSRNSLHLETVAQAGTAGFTASDLLTGSIPADGQTSAWLVRPSAGTVPSPSTGGTTPGGSTGGTGGDTGGTGGTGGTGDTGGTGGTGGGTGDTGGGTGGTGDTGGTGGTGGGSTEPPPPPPPQPPSVVFGADAGSNFYSVPIGQSKTLNFTYSNVGQGPATGVQASIQGSPVFTFQSNNCGTAAAPGELAAGSSCTITVKFTPTENVFYQAEANNLVVTSNDANSPHAIALSGFGARPAELQLSSTSLNLKTVPTITQTQRLTLTNRGDLGDLTLNDLSFGGSYTTLFAKTGGCTPNKVLTPGENCYVDVTFNPGVGAGASTPGTLRIGHSASAAVSEVALAADSTYTPANFIAGQGSLTGSTLTFTTSETGGRSVGVSRSKGKFTIAYSGTTSSLSQLQFMVNLLGGGYYGLDFVNGQVANSGSTNVVTGSANGALFGKPSLNSGDRVLMQLDFDNNTANWYVCSATSCGASPIHTMKAKVALHPYVYKYVNNNSATVTLQSSNVPGSPNPSTFHNGLPAN